MYVLDGIYGIYTNQFLDLLSDQRACMLHHQNQLQRHFHWGTPGYRGNIIRLGLDVEVTLRGGQCTVRFVYYGECMYTNGRLMCYWLILNEVKNIKKADY